MKKVLGRIGFLLLLLGFSLALFRGRSNYEEAVFMATYSDGTDLGIKIEMQRYGFDLDFMEEPTILDYCYSGIFF